jgi:hypothetical protein
MTLVNGVDGQAQAVFFQFSFRWGNIVCANGERRYAINVKVSTELKLEVECV